MDVKPELAETAQIWDRGWPQTYEEFEMLVDVYMDRLVLSAFRRLGNINDAEDVVQDVFLRAYSDRTKQKKILHVGPYLYRMLLNACTDVFRKRKRSKTSLESYQAENFSVKHTIPSNNIAAQEELVRIEKLLQRLPDKQAAAIRLRVFDELRMGEIAEIAGCSIDTVKSRLRYGFKKLRKIVSKEQKRWL